MGYVDDGGVGAYVEDYGFHFCCVGVFEAEVGCEGDYGFGHVVLFMGGME